MQLCHKYGLLAPEEPTGDPSAAGTQARGDVHGAKRGSDDQCERLTETEDRTVQRALPACGIPDDDNRERRPPEQQHTLNACGHQGGGMRGGEPLTWQRAPTARSQGPEENPRHGSAHP